MFLGAPILGGDSENALTNLGVAMIAAERARAQSDRAFARLMSGKVRSSSGAARLAAAVEHREGDLHWAFEELEALALYPSGTGGY